MSVVALTLFGEEILPAAEKPAVKSHTATRGKNSKSKKEDTAMDEPQILKGWEADKQYYSIGEVAGLFGVKNSHIRFWTTEFELKVRTTRKGDRLYAPEHIGELRVIYHLVKEKGFTISGAKAKLKEPKSLSPGTADLKQSLMHLRSELVQLRSQLV